MFGAWGELDLLCEGVGHFGEDVLCVFVISEGLNRRDIGEEAVT